MPETISISLRGVTKAFGRGVRALDGITLDISGGVFGLLGPNGAGKTTLMKILATLLTPTRGQVRIGPWQLPEGQHQVRTVLGYLPQEYGLFENLTAKEFLTYVAIMKGVGNGQGVARQVQEELERVGLNDARRRRVGTLSGGMRQRLGIAQAMLGRPQLLILDEPTAGLDPEERVRFRNRITETADRATIILSTHIVSDIQAACENAAVLHRGRLAFCGKLSALAAQAQGLVWEIKSGPDHPYLADPGAVVISSRREEEGIQMRVLAKTPPHPQATPCTPTVEDGYMALIAGPAAGRTGPAASPPGNAPEIERGTTGSKTRTGDSFSRSIHDQGGEQ